MEQFTDHDEFIRNLDPNLVASAMRRLSGSNSNEDLFKMKGNATNKKMPLQNQSSIISTGKTTLKNEISGFNYFFCYT